MVGAFLTSLLRLQVHKDEAALYQVDRVRRPIPDEKAIVKAVQMIRAAKHPLLLIGAGANRKRTTNMLRQFIDQTNIPFCDTQMGKGGLEVDNNSEYGTVLLSRVCDGLH